MADMPKFLVVFEDVGYTSADVSHVTMDAATALRLMTTAMSEGQCPEGIIAISSGYLAEDDHQQGKDKKVFVCITLEVLAENEEAAESIAPPTALLNAAADAMCHGLAVDREGNWDVSVGSAEAATHDDPRPRSTTARAQAGKNRQPLIDTSIVVTEPRRPSERATRAMAVARQIQNTWAHLQALFTELSIEDLPEPAGLKDAISFRLTGEQGDHSPYLAKIHLENFGSEHQEVYVDVLDLRAKIPACVASICVTLNHQGNPQVLITTDGQGQGDHNIVVDPLLPAEDAVEIDVHNSQLQRETP